MMRSSIVFRFVSVVIIVTALIVGVILPVAAQEVTAEATEAFTSEMMAMDSSCPQNVVSTLVEQLVAMPTDATEEAPAMDATEEAPVMEATEESMEATAEPVTGPLCLVGSLMGSAEVPGPGDEDGLGLVFVTFDSTTGEVCYEVAVANIELPAQAMHIHAAEAGVSGGVVIPFPTAPDAAGVAMGCTTAEDMAILADLAANPAGYYVNVHTTDFPDGAVRAQLMTLEDGHLMMEDMGLHLADMRGDTADATPEATPAQ
jgi:hypothetical protein